MAEPTIIVRNVSRKFPTQSKKDAALKGASFSAYPGQVLAIQGKSGSGKSTLLQITGLIQEPDQGSVEILGQRFDATSAESARTAFRRNNIGFIFQDFALFDFLSPIANIELPLILKQVPKYNYTKLTNEMLSSVQLTRRDVPNKKVALLSGGEKQRVAIARAVIADAPIILADEPTGNLDSATGSYIKDLLFDLAHKHHKTVIIVTHDPVLFEECDAGIALQDGQVHRRRRNYFAPPFESPLHSPVPISPSSPDADPGDSPYDSSIGTRTEPDFDPDDLRSYGSTMQPDLQVAAEADGRATASTSTETDLSTGNGRATQPATVDSLTAFQTAFTAESKPDQVKAPRKKGKIVKPAGNKSKRRTPIVRPAAVETPRRESKHEPLRTSHGPTFYELVRLAVRMMKGAGVVTWLNIAGLTIAITVLSFVGVFLYGVNAYINTIIQDNPRSFVITVTAKPNENGIDSATREDITAIGSNVEGVFPVEKARLSLRRPSREPHDFHIRSSSPRDSFYPPKQFLVGTGIQTDGTAKQPIDIVLTADATELLGFKQPERALGQSVIAQVTRKRKGETNYEHVDLQTRVSGVLKKSAQIPKGVSALLPLNVCKRLSLWQEAYLERFWDEHNAAIEISEAGYSHFGVFMGKASVESTVAAVQRHIPQAKPIENQAPQLTPARKIDWQFRDRVSTTDARQIPCFFGTATLKGEQRSAPQVNVIFINLDETDNSFDLGVRTMGGRGATLISHDLFVRLATSDRLPEQLDCRIRLTGLPTDWSTSLKTGGVALNLPPNTVLVNLADQEVYGSLDNFLNTPHLDQAIVYRVPNHATAVELCDLVEKHGGDTRRFALSQPTIRELKQLQENVPSDLPQLLGTAIDARVIMHFADHQHQPSEPRLALVSADAELFSKVTDQYKSATRDASGALQPVVVVNYRDMRDCPTLIEMTTVDPHRVFNSSQMIEAEFPGNWPMYQSRPVPLILFPKPPVRPPESRRYGIVATPQLQPSSPPALVASDSDYAAVGAGWIVAVFINKADDATTIETAVRDFQASKNLQFDVSHSPALRLPDSNLLISANHLLKQQPSDELVLTTSSYPRAEPVEFDIAGVRRAFDTDSAPLYSDQQQSRTKLVPFRMLNEIGLFLEKKRTYGADPQQSIAYSATHGMRHAAPEERGQSFLKFPFVDSRLRFEVPAEVKLTVDQIDQLQHRGTVGLVGHPEVVREVRSTNAGGTPCEIDLIGIRHAEIQWLKESTFFLDPLQTWDDFTGDGQPDIVISEDLAKHCGIWNSGDRTIAIQVSRPAEVDYANRSLNLKGTVAGVTHQPGLHAYVPLRLTRFLEGWKQGKSDFDSTQSRFTQNSGTQKVHDTCLIVEVKAQDIDSVEPTSQAITEKYGKRFVVETNLALIQQYKYYRSIALCVFSAIAVFGLIECLVALFCTFWAETLRRRRDIAIMRVLGTSKTNVLFLYLLPPQLINLVASVLGMSFTATVVYVAQLPGSVAWLTSYLKMDLSSLMAIPSWGPLCVFSVSALFCFLGSVIPALYASRIPVSDAMKMSS